jgi:hypothetical protein
MDEVSLAAVGMAARHLHEAQGKTAPMDPIIGSHTLQMLDGFGCGMKYERKSNK